MVLNEEAFDVAMAMRRDGDHFFQALSDCITRADKSNLQKIKNTWPAEWKRFYAKRMKYPHKVGEESQ